MDSNKLVINAEKTHLVVMGTKVVSHLRDRVFIQAGEHLIYPSEAEKLLGGHIHETLKVALKETFLSALSLVVSILKRDWSLSWR